MGLSYDDAIALATQMADAYNSGDISTYESLGGTASDTRTNPGGVATTAPGGVAVPGSRPDPNDWRNGAPGWAWGADGTWHYSGDLGAAGSGTTAAPTTQADLIANADKGLAPRARALLTDQPIQSRQFAGPRPLGFQPVTDIALPDQLRQATARQLGALDQDTLDSLEPVLTNKYNTSIAAYTDQAKRQSNGVGFQPASRLLGYSL